MATLKEIDDFLGKLAEERSKHPIGKKRGFDLRVAQGQYS
ncbi:MAG: hypothetical protein US53_C0051G0004 [Candidatus Woesebacteria bacterium GW2011_GWA1_37_7]|uniref:Uncharacterized protein n=1 Tax=Candidatus Woesebacteria bacterium GW2011_GWA1_37_7 TaxID=1618545 RepID=A0A0G0JI36_9BACT|nr:MAG: hypothetical protein US53_C0051G0004 [Candidatus Woesebacteria bacterium GW2011_GWA1_37_7]